MTTRGKFLFGATVGAWLNIWPPLFGGNAAFVLPILFGAWAFYELLRYRAAHQGAGEP